MRHIGDMKDMRHTSRDRTGYKPGQVLPNCSTVGHDMCVDPACADQCHPELSPSERYTLRQMMAAPRR